MSLSISADELGPRTLEEMQARWKAARVRMNGAGLPRKLPEQVKTLKERQAEFDRKRLEAKIAKLSARMKEIRYNPESPLVELIPLRASTRNVVRAVSMFYDVSVNDILSARRNASICNARHVAYFLTREMTPLSTTQMGAKFNRDHSTIVHGLGKIRELSKTDDVLIAALKDIRELIGTLNAERGAK